MFLDPGHQWESLLRAKPKYNKQEHISNQAITSDYRGASFQFLSTKTSRQNLFWQSTEINSGMKELSNVDVNKIKECVLHAAPSVEA